MNRRELTVRCPTCHARPGRKCRGDLPPIEKDEPHLTRLLATLQAYRATPSFTMYDVCPTCGGTGGVSATAPGEEEKGYVKPCPDCRPQNDTDGIAKG